MTTFTWTVNRLEVLSHAEGHADVVTVVHWRCTASDGASVEWTEGATRLTYDGSTDFTPFEQLSEAQVIGWVHGEMNKTMAPPGKAPETAELIEQRFAARLRAMPQMTALPWEAGNA